MPLNAPRNNPRPPKKINTLANIAQLKINNDTEIASRSSVLISENCAQFIDFHKRVLAKKNLRFH